TKTQFNSSSIVEMNGAVSGRNSWEVIGFGYSAKIDLNGKSYCFTSLFDFEAPNTAPAWLPGRIDTAVAARPLQGDSGAWLCMPDRNNTYAYVGNLIAVSRLRGIATFADELVAWASGQYGLQLKTF